MRYFQKSWVVILLFLPIIFSFLAKGHAEEDKGVKKYGVVHNIAEDREIEKIGGLYEPEGLDKYMKRHFDRLDQTIGQLEQSVKELSTQVLEVKRQLDNALAKN